MLFPGCGPRISSLSVLSLSLVAIPLGSGRGQEAATSLNGPSFVPDGSSSAVAGWHTLGPAAWGADQGEIVGKETGGSGWLVLDHSFQDTGHYASFRGTGPCDTGVLLRLQQTPEGMHGTYLASVATEETDGHGPVALYVGKGCELRFKNIAYKDLAIKRDPPEEVGSGFRMQRLSPFCDGWSAAAADFNRDVKMDIVGPFIYFGPDFLTSREIYSAEAYNAPKLRSMNDWVEHAYDFTGDGWPDVLTTSHAGGSKGGAVLYVNPKGESQRWEKYRVVPVIQSEEMVPKEVDDPYGPADIYWYKTGRNPKAPGGGELVLRLIHNRSGAGSDVLAVDLNRDGRMDIVTSARSGTYLLGKAGRLKPPAKLTKS